MSGCAASTSQRTKAVVYPTGRIHAVLALVAVCLLTVGCGASQKAKEMGGSETPDRPNVILIVADDLDAESVKYMPRLTSLLADKGTTFENAFVTDPLCCPSRATTLRGQYAHNTRIEGNEPPRGGHEKFRTLGLDRSTMATWMQEAGYRTAFVGKYMNGYEGRYVPPGWDEWYAVSGNYLSKWLNENGRINYYDPQRYHLDDVLADRATDYVHRAASGGPPSFAIDRPFFMWLAPTAPHQPATPAPRHEDAFADVSLPAPPSFDENDVSEKPAWIRDNPPLSEEELAYMEELYRDRLRSMLAVDEMIGRLVDALKDQGELDNTYILFTSDNGFHLGQHRLGAGKWTAYEEDIRVPLIVRGPGVPEGVTKEQMVLNNDLAPTFADLAQTEAPDFVDGRSLAPLLTHSAPPRGDWRKAFLVEAAAELAGVPAPPFFNENRDKPLLTGDPLPRQDSLLEAVSRGDSGRPGLKALRTEDYLYVEYETGERELYDLEKDPYQLNNVYEGSDPNLLWRLQERLGQLRGCAGINCRAVEDAQPMDVS